jgi:hypothetical protein
MKKLITLLLIPLFASGQSKPYVSFSVGVDVRNALIGSQPTNNKPEVDYLIGFNMISYNRFDVGIFYENFNRIKFTRYGASVGYQLPITEKLTLTPAVEFSLINRGEVEREFEGNGGFISYGVNCKLQYPILNNLDVSLKGNFIKRNDLSYLYGGTNLLFSGYFEFVYKLPLE